MKPNLSAKMATTAVLFLFLQGVGAAAAEIKVIGLVGMTPLMKELGPQFERSSGHKLSMRFGSGPESRRLIESGEVFDLAVLNLVLFVELTKQGRIAATTRTEIFRNGMGVAGRSGAAKPDITTVDAFKQTLLNAKTITYAPSRSSGIHLAKVLDRLGIAEQMKSKTKPQPEPDRVAQAVAAGEAELGFAAINLLIGVPGAVVIGPFPVDLQDYIVFTAGIGVAATEPQAARTLLDYMKSEPARSVMKAQGLEPL
jgi:molybdate transport system substrate-binding protein